MADTQEVNFRFPSQLRDRALLAPPGAVARAAGRPTARHASAALPASRADALSIACRTLASAPAADMLTIGVTSIVGRDADGTRSLRALVADRAEQYGLGAEVDLEPDSGSFTVRFSRG